MGRQRPQDWEEVSQRARHAAVPDLGVALDGGAERLYELKTITECRSRYAHCSRGGALRPASESPCGCGPCTRGAKKELDRRASTVITDTLRRLSDLDSRLLGTPPGVDGPLVERLRALGGVQPLVSGAFGGVCTGFQRLLTGLAVSAARHKWNDLLAPSESHCAGVLRVQLQRDLCFTLARGRSRLLRERLADLRRGFKPPHAPGSGGPDWERRERARFRAGRPAANSFSGAGFTHSRL